MSPEAEQGSGTGSARGPESGAGSGQGSSGTPRVTVELTEYERIVPGGTKGVSYRVRVHDGWVRAGSCQGALTERLPSEPQVVWARRIRVALGVGTEVERTVVTPTPGNPAASTFDYLAGRTARQCTRVQRQVFRIDRSGNLVSVHSPKAGS